MFYRKRNTDEENQAVVRVLITETQAQDSSIPLLHIRGKVVIIFWNITLLPIYVKLQGQCEDVFRASWRMLHFKQMALIVQRFKSSEEKIELKTYVHVCVRGLYTVSNGRYCHTLASFPDPPPPVLF